MDKEAEDSFAPFFLFIEIRLSKKNRLVKIDTSQKQGDLHPAFVP
jgi:hypothetical protein